MSDRALEIACGIVSGWNIPDPNNGICNAIAEALREYAAGHIAAPVPEMAGTKPVILYFHNDADRDEFIAVVHEAKPGMIAREVKL